MPKGRFAEDITGKRFGMLTVIRRSGKTWKKEATWLCRCDCGNEKVITGVHLRKNQVSCGCMMGKILETNRGKTFLDETGNKYGKLTVIRLFKSSKKDGVLWLCRCDCGNEKIVSGSNLRNQYGKGVRSCGCMYKLPTGEAAFNQLFTSFKGGARKRNLSFELTKEQVRDITQKDCVYCGKPPQQEMKAGNGSYFYNGIDRINSKIGYTLENSVPCCGRCNRAKHIMMMDEFRDFIVTVYRHWAIPKS